MSETIAVIGLGYVGLPVALAFAKKFKTIGFDVDRSRVEGLRQGYDRNNETSEHTISSSKLQVTTSVKDLQSATFWVVAVPTPVDENNVPDLTPMLSATATIAPLLKKGDVVVYESTVYPGVTEDICGPLLLERSGLDRSDFKLGYSPERINPGDKEHTLERIVKVVSGEDAETLERVANVYGAVIDAGVYRATSIKVAEAAKIIENTQRDINIALMNELSLIFNRIGISTADVLAAAGTKWNFLKFTPGLVGGHCIGVDPYYLTTMAARVGYHPEVILAGRRINDNMGKFVAQRTVKMLINAGLPVKGATVGVLGLTFKENVCDLRNSKVYDIIQELEDFGVEVLVHDPLVNPEESEEVYGCALSPLNEFKRLDAVILAVPHREFLQMGATKMSGLLRPDGVFVDVKSAFSACDFPATTSYWSL